ncbi:dTDP-glucose 4,6-dehydratase [Streptoalloteichus tenebrarius]|uniref:dTDP-glucose 4,6-dehydratase n=1 Tax=Streptoalloteichus tenebrarius (strain ATCC 17920 / DSM 40477 / JCM 4838 / CBS 697.72 / NBRC 16177 / NCIMB 11028 / NRRL B-12390 / A12253. 1 / ISP 5477) TaxID=1933 RepID=UPI0035F036C1
MVWNNVLVTGGAGFIGSHFVTRLLAAGEVGRVTVLDALTYAGSIHNLGEAFLAPHFRFVHGDITDHALVDAVVGEHDAVVHFAAESHVDRSFSAAGRFVSTNVAGTQILLDAAMRHGVRRFVHVSTDEVYGPVPTGVASEDDPLRPTVPYAASKAASDLMALSYHRTFGVPVCVTRSANNYGPRQHPEKIIPLFVTRLLKGHPVTLHGRGEHVRHWLHVTDHCQGIEVVLREGVPGEIYNIGGGTELTNRELTERILRACDADWGAVEFVEDRRCNDLRYAMDCTKITRLGYRPVREFADGLAETVEWYRAHPDRWAPLLRAPQTAGAPAGEGKGRA